MKKLTKADLSFAAAIMGRKGGAAGTGKAKRRSAAHYRRLAELRKAKRGRT